ncbi:MAG: type II toxin-antitoxin system RelE/ParE family toxin [Candidatus Dojkabacteria bacterium]
MITIQLSAQVVISGMQMTVAFHYEPRISKQHRYLYLQYTACLLLLLLSLERYMSVQYNIHKKGGLDSGKRVIIDKRFEKDFRTLPKSIQMKFATIFSVLETKGNLQGVDDVWIKKLVGYDLFEIKIRYKGQWRCFYSYTKNEQIIILHLLLKKTNKTPSRVLKTAISRLKEYE